jgi:uncharacterized protein (TIGR02145 family)
MKQFGILIITLLLFHSITAQIISNVVAKQDANKVVITYNLQCEDVTEISLYVSEIGDGVFDGPLQGVAGDVGSVLMSGNKTILWDVSIDKNIITGENIVFRVKGTQKFGKFTDNRDGKIYNAVKIGDQVIMAENLAYFCGNGCWAIDKDKNSKKYFGYYYEWEKAKKVCPTGWHLPSKEEFTTLLKSVGNSDKEIFNALLPNGNSGFSTIFGGYHNIDGNFYYTDSYAYFWTISLDNNDKPWYFLILKNSSSANLYNINSSKQAGLSIRCLRNDN